MAPKPPREDIKREERDRIIFNQYLEDATQSEIAKELGVAQSTISKAIKKRRGLLLKEGLIDTKEQIMVIEERYNAVRKAAWESFRSTGEPGFLRVIQDSLKAVRDLHGLDRPKAIEMTNIDAVKVSFQHRVVKDRAVYEELQALKQGELVSHGSA